MPSVTGPTLNELHDFMVEAFDPESLRDFVRGLPAGEVIAMSLGDPAMPMDDQVFRAVSTLRDRGQIDENLMVRLMRHFPSQIYRLWPVATQVVPEDRLEALLEQVEQPAGKGGFREADVERMMELAEKFHASIEATRGRMESWKMIQATLLGWGLIGFMAFGAWRVTSGASVFEFMMVVLGGTLALAFGLVPLNYAKRRAERAIRPEERALDEVVAILREVEQQAARDGRWSNLQRAEFRIRLSRFDVGMEYASEPVDALSGERFR